MTVLQVQFFILENSKYRKSNSRFENSLLTGSPDLSWLGRSSHNFIALIEKCGLYLVETPVLLTI
jgi:hypothetical protein